MPVPNSVKEIKQFLGLTGYYRKFVPRFADISRPLTTLTKKDVKFEWTPACQKSFELLKETLCGEPVLKYADTSKPYTLYTDASKFSWAGVLTQLHTAFPGFMQDASSGIDARCFLPVFLFLILLCLKCALVWGNCCERLRVEIFVRVLRSSRVNFNKVNNTNVFSCV